MLLRKFKKAQGATEYAIFIAAVLAGLLALQVYYSRSVKGNMKGRADSIGEQFDGKEGSYIRESRSASTRQSFTNRNTTIDGVEMGSRHSINVAATAQKAGEIKGEWLDVFGGAVARDKHIAGDVSSTEYVTDFTDGAGSKTTGFGKHGYADMGNITGGGNSVYSDGVYKNRTECLEYESAEMCSKLFP